MFILGWTFASMSFICVCVSDDEPVHPLAQRQRHRVADIVSQFAFGRGPYRQADGRIAAAVTAAAEASTRSAGRFLHRGSTAHTSSGVRIWGRTGQMGDVCRCEDMVSMIWSRRKKKLTHTIRQTSSRERQWSTSYYYQSGPVRPVQSVPIQSSTSSTSSQTSPRQSGRRTHFRTNRPSKPLEKKLLFGKTRSFPNRPQSSPRREPLAISSFSRSQVLDS
ncbi:hypothetical protein HDK90DRAFT_191287 [Phyllosticta capitalensis]|uniref:Secreted protein n=1 Tax=Phyllosticta capitalensis TaxID=121624 RepID=A0ABR1YXT3_9PEZI